MATKEPGRHAMKPHERRLPLSAVALALSAGSIYESIVQPATILVVDDEHLIRWTLAERLTAEGCRVQYNPRGLLSHGAVTQRTPP